MVFYPGDGCQFRFTETVKVRIEDDGYALIPAVNKAIEQIYHLIQTHYIEIKQTVQFTGGEEYGDYDSGEAEP